MADEAQVAKLERHLSLLRQEYVKLQNRLIELEQKYSLAVAASGQTAGDHENTFVNRLLKTVAELYDKDLYSDITVSFADQKIKAHKFVLAARGDHWSSRDLNEISELQLIDVSASVGLTLMKWVYTDQAEIPNDESFLIELVKTAKKYRLKELKERCEKMLMSSVSVSNCIKFYQTAEDIGAKDLQKYCAEIISNHWHDLKTEDFTGMSAALLYEMFKSKSGFPLHLAVRHHREDVVFLFLIEFDSQLPGKLNEVDPSSGHVPLHIALTEQQESIARTLVNHGCDVDMPNIADGQCLLHKAIMQGDEFSARFLIKNGANSNAATHNEHVTPLHLAASYRPWSATSIPKQNLSKMTSSEGMARIADLLLENGANGDGQDSLGRTALHRAIEAKNDAVLSVLLQKAKLNFELRTNEGHVPLWLALSCDTAVDPMDEDSLAARLLKHGASPDAVNNITGDSLLHMAAASGLEEAGLFLASHGAQPNHTNKHGEMPLHVAARKGLAKLVSELLNNGANPNAQTTETEGMKVKSVERAKARETAKKEARHKAIDMFNEMQAIKAAEKAKELEQRKKTHKLPSTKTEPRSRVSTSKMNSFEEDLGHSTNPFDEDNSNPFLEDIRAASAAASALSFGGNPFEDTSEMESSSLPDPSPPSSLEISETDAVEAPTEDTINKLIDDNQLYKDPYVTAVITECYGRTPLHIAVTDKHEDVVNCFIDFQGSLGRGGRLPIVPDFNLSDSEDQTPLELALCTGQMSVARRLIEAGANVELQTATNGLTLLHKAVRRGDSASALFLLDHGADINNKTKDNKTPLQLAIQCHLQPVVDALCQKGADLNNCDEKNNCPLWVALKSGQQDIAATLVKYGCDTDAWNVGPNGCTQSLLHRAIQERDEPPACFLIRSRCDISSPRRPGPDGDGGVEAWDGMTPLHLACETGLDNVVQALVEHKVNVNCKDSESRSPIHIAITSKHPIVIRLLLSHPELNMNVTDRSGQTPFAVALRTRDHEAAAAILSREPGAAEQFDSKGRNFLHSAIHNVDVETVLFLIGVSANVNSRIQDSSNRTPLHLAVNAGSEILVRHLLLAGSRVNDVNKHRQTALHMASANNSASIISILLENGVEPDAADEKGNNALHVAVQCGHVEAVRVLLTESSINAEAFNARGQNPLHILSQYAKDNAVAIFDLFRQSMPEYPLNALDADENTALFLAYTNGAARLCRELLKAGGSLNTINKHAVSIFNAQVPTKKLLFTLLDMLSAEPQWIDGPVCHECGTKFSVTTRKHHCRHCGRLLCAKCSAKQIPIMKYDLHKPVRVCDVCFEMLTSGLS